MDLVRTLILERLDKARITMSAASLSIGRNASYLQQFLKRGIPEELHERDRAALAVLLGVPEEDLRGTSPPLGKRPYAKGSGDRSRTRDYADPFTPGAQNAVDSMRPFGMMKNHELPVFGTALTKGGAFVVTLKPVNYEARPEFLARVEDGYGLIMRGDAMDPECKNGSIVLVNPHLPPKNGDTVVLRGIADDGTPLAMVRQLVRATERSWFVHQHNPKKNVELKRSEWPDAHAVVANYSRR